MKAMIFGAMFLAACLGNSDVRATEKVGGLPPKKLSADADVTVNKPWLVGDVSYDVLDLSDSLGGRLHGAPFLKIANRIATKFPLATVNYFEWSDDRFNGTNSFGNEPFYTRKGTNGVTINWYNAYVGSTTPYYLMGAKFQKAVADVNPRFIIWNHGKNVVNSPMPDADFLAPAEMVRLAKPGVPQIYIEQLPNRDDDKMAVINKSVLPDIVALYRDGTSIVDTYTYIDELKMKGLPYRQFFDDNLHPNSSGVDNTLLEPLWKKLTETPMPSHTAKAFLANKGNNLIPNGDFSQWSGQYPDGFSSPGNNAHASREDVVKDNDTQYSLKLTGSAASSQIRYAFSASQLSELSPELSGKPLLLQVKLNTAGSTSPTAGFIGISWSDASGAHAYNKNTNVVGPKGGWSWLFLKPPINVVGPVTDLQIRLGVDTAKNGGDAESTVFYQRAILVSGSMPSDMHYETN